MFAQPAPARRPAGQPRPYRHASGHPVRRYGGVAAVLLLHAALIYALLNGLANRVAEIVQHPVDVRIIAPVKPPPPLPPPKPIVKAQPSKVVAPPRMYVPPPEVPVQAQAQSTLAHTATPVVSAPALPAAPAAPVAPSHEVGVVCPNSEQVRASLRYPREALENNITGNVLVEFVVDADGRVSGERVAQSADPILDRAALAAVRRFSCIAQGQAVRVQVPFSFNLN
ncbi:MAG: energy transducer TonB [Burkholderia sp.]|jgi:protein TonB|uniref:energy transducer TonB n=1 Tax=Burkholderia sp. TaxID=36773 RepID=UPI002583B27B|nr:energy transducer TonB [Burkholderia sp.]MCA3779563.1 energy transducer TonB [Burkholderia sp.]MCA3790640.1 energy transducer TonB [Burkholderia sp.]MCA3797775.1 energy transducer TonB [Burkholderia sp.]MCA3799809.1 energy transducer TonB [Burkholderia sp.]MCA3812391.1 energy transducer TonB [Burkholderia sp.]